MESSLLEIVEMPNGDIVLRRAGDEGETLVKIQFSDEARQYLPEGRLEVASVMIHAGIQAAAQLSGGQAELDYVAESTDTPPVLH